MKKDEARKYKVIGQVAVLIIVIAVWGCSRNRAIVVVSKNFTEQIILGEMMAQQIERKMGLPVERRLNLGGTFLCHQALISDQADLYVEYSGTALTAILKREPKSDSSAVYEEVRSAYRDQFQLEWLNPLGFNNTFAMIIRGETARENNIRTISQAAAYTPQWKAGFGYEFSQRKDGFPGLAAVYGLKFSGPPRVMDLSLTYRAVAEKQVDFIAGNSTDGTIAKLDLFVLEDDRHYFPPYYAGVIVRAASLQKHPRLKETLEQLSGKISEDTMRRLNYQVDGERRDVKDVVSNFLEGIK